MSECFKRGVSMTFKCFFAASACVDVDVVDIVVEDVFIVVGVFECGLVLIEDRDIVFLIYLLVFGDDNFV